MRKGEKFCHLQCHQIIF